MTSLALRPILDRVRTDITAVKMPDGTSIWKRDQPLTSERIEAHLKGELLRGVCQIKEGESTTRLALLDLDSHKGETSWDDMLIVAQKVYDALLLHGIFLDGFKSSGGKGIHLIAIWDEPQDAYSVRKVLREALAEIGYRNGTGGVAKGEIEIFPKQDSVPIGGCGNQFILPYSPKGQPLVEPEWRVSEPVPIFSKPLPQPAAYPAFYDKPDMAEAVSALQSVPAQDYDTWVRMGMALADAFGEAGFAIWDAWSSTASNYDSKIMRGKWRSFKNDGITIASLFDEAKLNGWKPEPIERPPVDTSAVDGFVSKISGKMRDNPAIIPYDPAPSQPASDPLFGFDPLKLDGLIGDTVRWICSDSPLPQPMLALLNTLAFAGSVFGRRYASPMNTRTNVYMIGVADTGAGKDHSRKKIGTLAKEAGLSSFLGGHAIRSDTGMLRGLESNCCQLLMLDEFGKLLQALSDKKAASHLYLVAKTLMNLYSDSGGTYHHGDYANAKENKAIIIDRPNLCVYGTTTEEEYVKALTLSAVRSGELNRCMAIRVGNAERKRINSVTALPDELKDDWEQFNPINSGLGAMLNTATNAPVPTIVEWGDCDDLQWEICQEQDALIASDKATGALWVRRHENILKIAMIFAIARSKLYPVFQKRDFEVAKIIVDASVRYMIGLLDTHIAENEYESYQQRIVSYVRSNRGGVSMTDLHNKFRSIKPRDRKDIIADLVGMGIINIEQVETGARKRTVVTIV